MGKAQCSKDYLKGVQQQLDMMEKLRSSGPEFVGQICSLIEGGSALIGGELPDKILRLTVVLDRLAEVEDVDATALPEDERLHLGIPTLGLVSEVHACFEQVLHRERNQIASNHGCH